MADLLNLGCWHEDGILRVVVEAPQGSNAKLKYSPGIGAFTLQRFIPEPGYPYDWGFVPGTLGEDGDPLDAMVIHDGHSWPGVIIPSIAIGVVQVTETKEGDSKQQRNDRLIAVPAARPAPCSVGDLQPDLRSRLERFFVQTGELAKKRVTIEGWASASDAAKLVAHGAAAFAKSQA